MFIYLARYTCKTLLNYYYERKFTSYKVLIGHVFVIWRVLICYKLTDSVPPVRDFTWEPCESPLSYTRVHCIHGNDSEDLLKVKCRNEKSCLVAQEQLTCSLPQTQ